jgi:hypothetical protein
MLLFREAANYFLEADHINTALLDLKLITVSDYAVSLWISEGLWQRAAEEWPEADPPLARFEKEL